MSYAKNSHYILLYDVILLFYCLFICDFLYNVVYLFLIGAGALDQDGFERLFEDVPKTNVSGLRLTTVTLCIRCETAFKLRIRCETAFKLCIRCEITFTLCIRCLKQI